MSNFFESKETALKMAIYWSGGPRDKLKKEDELLGIEQFGSFIGNAEVYNIPSLNGELARFGIVQEPRGWTVWFIGDNGIVIRA